MVTVSIILIKLLASVVLHNFFPEQVVSRGLLMFPRVTSENKMEWGSVDVISLLFSKPGLLKSIQHKAQVVIPPCWELFVYSRRPQDTGNHSQYRDQETVETLLCNFVWEFLCSSLYTFQHVEHIRCHVYVHVLEFGVHVNGIILGVPRLSGLLTSLVHSNFFMTLLAHKKWFIILFF